MPTYKYQAQTRDGKIINSTIEAVNLNLAIDTLTGKKLKILDITPARFDPASLLAGFKSIKRQSVVMFTRQMVTLVKSGLSIDKSLSVLAEQEENDKFKSVLGKVLHDIRVGSTMSWAMSRHPEVFDALYISMIKVGETTGDMGGLLERLATFLEKDSNVRQKAKSAMSYPIFIFVVCAIVIGGIFLYVMPPLLDTFQQMASGQEMPLPTKIMFFLTDIIKNPIFYLSLALLVIYYFFFVRSYLETPSGKYKLDRFKLSIPVFGDLNRKLLISNFCRVLGTLLSTGVPLLKSLEILEDFAGNSYFKNSIVGPIISGIEDGDNMSGLIEDSGFFPDMVTNMIAVGETTGEIPTMLQKISDFYDKEVIYALDSALTLLEPIMIAVMGVLVCFVLLSVFLPLYQVIMNMS